MKVIGLYGIGGVYNFGCEAIVRGANKLIHQIYQDVKVLYFSRNYEYDVKMLEDIDVEVIPIDYKRLFIDRVKNKICIFFGLDHRPLCIDYKNMIDRIDEIWSIGGDIYTIPQVKREKNKYEYYNQVVDFCDRASNRGKEVILYGASVGPFGSYNKAVEYYKKNLVKYKRIFAREQETVKYLCSLNINNVMFFPDPAFQVESCIVNNETAKKEFIGLNFSPLSLNEIYGDHGIESQKRLSRLIEKIVDEFKEKILLVPHVISKSENDDDLRFLNQVFQNVDKNYKEWISIADYSKGFIGLKPQLRRCKFVASARMHCCINAIKENVPAIFLSYSKKSIGMGRYIYNSDRWVLSLKDLDSSLIPLMREMNELEEQLSIYLDNRNNEIKQEYERLIDTLKT